jgi:hypothetical protein
METIRKRKSESLAKSEHSALRKFRKGFQTEVDCAMAIGIDRAVLNRILFIGSGSPETVDKIRKALSKHKTN